MSNNDYREGFKDGFAAGLEEGKKTQKVSSTSSNPISIGIGCYRCGRNYYDTSVCYDKDCPLKISSVDISKPMTGDFY